jgi:membrane protein implicated in regulation of membrane protease activity
VLLILVLILALIFLPMPWSLLVIAVAAVLELSLWFFGIRYSRRRKAQVGVQTMIGLVGEAISTLAPEGQVKVDGEIWQARAEEGARAGDHVRVTAVRGLMLDVEKTEVS